MQNNFIDGGALLKQSACLVPSYAPLKLPHSPTAARRPKGLVARQTMLAMKFTLVLLTVAFLNVSARTMAQNVSISVRNASLETVFRQIEKQSKYVFFTKADILDDARKVTLHLENVSLHQALSACLKDQPITYSIEGRIISIGKKQISSSKERPVPAPGIPVTGTVRSEDHNTPLSGATITIKQSGASYVTDANGKFSLTLAEGDVLVISYVGYEPKEMKITASMLEKFKNSSGQFFIPVYLEEKGGDLGKVVVVGYGTQKREKVTTSIARVDNQVLKNVPYSNAASALQGTASGVQVQSISGQPGAAPRVIIRGGTSINNPNGAAPLYIVDGVIRENLNDINPSDIESINILKDAAATSIYGARGSNGVVLVNTMKGKSGKVRVEYRYSLTASEPSMMYEFANAREYIEFNRLGIQRAAIYTPSKLARLGLPNGYGTGNDLSKNTAYTPQYLSTLNEHKLKEGWDTMPDPIDPTKTILFKNTDFQDLTYRTAMSHNHHLTLLGGSEKASFNAGVGYMGSEGTVITTKYNRLTLNLGGDLKVKDNLSFFGRTMFTSSNNNEVYSLPNIFYRSAGTPPSTKYAFEDGSLAPGQSRSIGNPVYHLNNDFNKNSIDQLTLSIGGQWDIMKGLSLKPQFSLYKQSIQKLSFIPSYWNGATTFNDTRAATASYANRLQKQADVLLSYRRVFNEAHNLDATAGFSYFDRELNGISAAGQGAATDLIPTLNASATPTAVGGSISNQVLVGYFGSLNYDYKNRFLLTINSRYDGASNLGAMHRWGFFPGVSVGWNLHETPFWDNSPLANILRMKLRGSFGTNGNISGLSDFQSQGEYSVQNRYGGVAAVENTVLANDALKWEQSRTLNLGTEISLFNRVSITAEIYRRVTENLITSLSLPQSTGFTSIYTNLGSLENKGVEMEFSADVFERGNAFQWRTSVIASKTNHKILKLPENGNPNNRVGGVYVWDPVASAYAWLGGLQEGGRINDQYGYRQVRIYPTDEEAAKGPLNTLIPGNNKTSYGGYVEWYDADGNGKIDASDRVFVGNYLPVWNGGLSNKFTYKDLSLYVRMDFTTGHTIYNYARRFMNNNSQGDGNFLKEMATDSWQKQGDIARLPLYTHQQAYNFPVGHDEYYEKGDFLNIREVTLSYELPAALRNKVKINGARVYVTGSNLHYFTKYKGLNPEEGGEDDGRYPVPRNITFGASIAL